MKLCGIDFWPAFQASGATNFYGDGWGRGHEWWYDKWLRSVGLNWRNSTVVTKTTTLLPRAGNMPLKKDGVTPKEWAPRCIIVNWEKKVVLNAVSLSGPGLEFLLQSGEWHKRTEPFFISVMSLQQTAEGRLAELDAIFDRLGSAKRHERFRADWGVQINFSCPNGGVNPSDLIDEVLPVLRLADKHLPDTVPLMPKFGPEAHHASMQKIVKHSRCNAICAFNTLPFGKQPTWAKEAPPVDWIGLFGTDDPKNSPLARRFPVPEGQRPFAGGLSGAPLLPFVLEWVRAVRALGITTPINAGGGILSPNEAGRVFDAGADSIFLGSIALLAPTKVRATIEYANQYARALAQNALLCAPPYMEYNV